MKLLSEFTIGEKGVVKMVGGEGAIRRRLFDMGVTPGAEITLRKKAPLGDRLNMVFSGCSITYGTATAVVTATGMNTEMGKIAGLLNGEEESQTPLQKKLSQLGKYLGLVALAACAVIFVVGLLNDIAPLEIFMTAVSLAVSAIPRDFLPNGNGDG